VPQRSAETAPLFGQRCAADADLRADLLLRTRLATRAAMAGARSRWPESCVADALRDHRPLP
jgi:hypothetical protein